MFVQWTLLSGEISVLFTRIFLPLNIEPSVVSPSVSIQNLQGGRQLTSLVIAFQTEPDMRDLGGRSIIGEPSREILEGGGPQLFWHQRLISWKVIFPRGTGARGNGFRTIQAYCIYCALYFCYYISCTSDDQPLDPGSWGALLKGERRRVGEGRSWAKRRFWPGV